MCCNVCIGKKITNYKLKRRYINDASSLVDKKKCMTYEREKIVLMNLVLVYQISN